MNEEISEFYKLNNISPIGSNTLFDTSTQLAFTTAGAHFIVTRDDSTSQIKGCIVVLPLSVEIDKSTFSVGNITYLCVSRHHRKEGLARELFSRIGNLANSLNIPLGYSTGLATYMTTARSVEIRSWYRPLRHRIAAELGYEFPSYRNSSDRSDYRTSIAYNCNLPANLIVKRVESPTNSSIARDFYCNITDKCRIRYMPTNEEWERWIKAFPTYLVFESEQIIGLFMVNLFTARVNNGKIGKFALLLLVVGQILSTLKAALYITHQLGNSVVYGYEVGGITEEEVKEIKGLRTRLPIHLSFHLQDKNNLKLIPSEIEPADILLPLL